MFAAFHNQSPLITMIFPFAKTLILNDEPTPTISRAVGRTVCHFNIVEKVAHFQRGYTMILFKNSKYLSYLLFCKKTLVFSFDNVVFLKGGFLDAENVILL